MGINVVLQDERCSEISSTIADTGNVIAQSLPDETDRSFGLIRFIDPYGDTVFNRLQAAAMIEEWDRLKSSFSERDADEIWDEVRKLIMRCSEEPHTYLRFIGD